MNLITIWQWLSNLNNRERVALIASVIFAIVGGLWAVYIHISGPKAQPDINQHISGESTGVVHTGTGSVFITNTKGVSTKEFQRLAEELGITKAALNTFLKILEEKQVPLEDLDHTLRKIAQRYNELKKELEAFRSDDPAIVELKKRARDALDVGNFEEAERLLNEASDKDVDAARRLKKVAEERFLSAAASKAENGDLKWTQLDYFAAAGYYRKAAELVPEGHDEQLAKHLNMAGRAYNEAGRYSEAEPLYKRSLQIREKVLRPEHPNVATSLNNLASLYRDQGRYPEAEPLYKRSLEIWEKVLGPEHPNVATILNNLALLYRGQGRYPEAEPLFKRSLKIKEKVLGPEHPNVATVIESYADLLQKMDRETEAAELEARAESIRNKKQGPF